jgi:hypothetical protein
VSGVFNKRLSWLDFNKKKATTKNHCHRNCHRHRNCHHMGMQRTGKKKVPTYQPQLRQCKATPPALINSTADEEPSQATLIEDDDDDDIDDAFFRTITTGSQD